MTVSLEKCASAVLSEIADTFFSISLVQIIGLRIFAARIKDN